MTIYLWDALYPAGIPLTIGAEDIVASYVDHPEVHPAPMIQLAARFPNNRRMSISAHNHDADICDVESGAMTPDMVPSWTVTQRSRGVDPSCYAAPGTWPTVQHECRQAGVPYPHWWAVVRAHLPFIPVGAVANQFLGAGPYDKSILAPTFPGLTPPPPAPVEETDMPTIYTNTTTGDPAYGASFIDYGGGYAPGLTQLTYGTEVGLGAVIKGVDAYTWERLWTQRNEHAPTTINEYTLPAPPAPAA